MTNLIYFELPLLLLIPAFAAIASVICALLHKNTIVSYTGAIIHAFAIAAIIYFGGNLTDIFLMLVISLAVSVITEGIRKKAVKEEKR